jgi:hypothetical protein
MFYIHPWELDPDQPRMDVPLLTRMRHYGGLNSALTRLEQLLGEFRFTSVGACLAAHAKTESSVYAKLVGTDRVMGPLPVHSDRDEELVEVLVTPQTSTKEIVPPIADLNDGRSRGDDANAA